MDESKTLSESIKDARTPAEFWLSEIDSAKKYFDDWYKRADKVDAVYRGDSEKNQEKFNILWSNTEVMRPILYSRVPKPMVERRFKEEEGSNIARIAAHILERCLDYCIQIEGQELDIVMEKSVLDHLLSGRVVTRAVYEPYISKKEGGTRDLNAEEVSALENNPKTQIPGRIGNSALVRLEDTEEKTWEEAYIKYEAREDFLHSLGKSWDEVWWVAFGANVDKDSAIEQFGAEIANKLKITAEDKDEKQKRQKQSGVAFTEEQRTFRVWEIWNKRTREVIFVAEGNDFILKKEDDPLGLINFFPCPRPVYSIFTNNSLIPVPEYTQYQYQAEELNIISRRISKLTKVLMVRGIYDSSVKSLARLLDGEENELIPDASFGKLAQLKGIEGAVIWLPISLIADVLSKLIALRESTKNVIYEIVGIADILRGASDPRETATAQRIKGQFGGLRIRKRQKEIQRFARDQIRILAEIIAEQFSPETLIAMSGAPQDDPATTQFMEQVIDLLRNDALRSFRIDIETDSTIAEDEEREKREVVEFMAAMGQFLGQAFTAVQTGMMPPEVAQEILLFATRRFRAGRKLEGALEKIKQQAQQQPRQDDGKNAELQGKLQIEMAKLQQEDKHFYTEMQLEVQKLQKELAKIEATKEIAKMKAQTDILAQRINQQTVKINARGGKS